MQVSCEETPCEQRFFKKNVISAGARMMVYLFLVKSGCSSLSLGWKNLLSSADWLTRGSLLRSSSQYFCKNFRCTMDLVGPFCVLLCFIFLSESTDRTLQSQILQPLLINAVVYIRSSMYLGTWGGLCQISSAYLQMGIPSLVVSGTI